ARALEARHESPQTPDCAEEVGMEELLQPIRVRLEEPAPPALRADPPAGEAGVVDEQLDRRVSFRDPRPDLLDRLAVADVADLVLPADLLGHLPEALLVPGDQDAVPALPGQLPRDRGADARVAARDDADRAGYRHTRTTRAASAVRFPALTTARSRLSPGFADRVRQVMV